MQENGPTTIDDLRKVGLGDLMMPAKGQRLVDRIRQAIPFEHIAASGLDLEGFGVGTGTILASNFPVAYMAEYYREAHHAHDPLVKLVLSRDGSVSDEQAWSNRRRNANHRRLLTLMDDHGIRNRTAVPLVRAGRVYGSVGVTSKRPLTEGELEYLEFVAAPLHDALSQPYVADIATRMGLTKGELRCIELASRGLTSEGIAKQSAYSFETVNSYLKSATKKLGAANRPQAVAEAIRRRLIS